MPPLSQPAAWRGSRTPIYSSSPALQSLHSYARHIGSASSLLARGQRVWKVGFGKNSSLHQLPFVVLRPLLPLFPLSFFTAEGFFSSCISHLPLCLKGYQHSRRQHMQALSLLYYTKCIPFSVPPRCGEGEMSSFGGCWMAWRQTGLLLMKLLYPWPPVALIETISLVYTCCSCPLSYFTPLYTACLSVPTDPCLSSAAASIGSQPLYLTALTFLSVCIIFNTGVQCPFTQWELEVTSKLCLSECTATLLLTHCTLHSVWDRSCIWGTSPNHCLIINKEGVNF